ncbi:MAG: hypothetical protein E7168_02615 [Firmicutes bacterium]|nr:hypothetical protein [Bacillota bacterium]
MLKLNESNLNKIFSECEWPYSEWGNKHLKDSLIPDGARLLVPFENGENTVTFHPDRLKEHHNEICCFLDQVAGLEFGFDISISMLRFLKTGESWTTNFLEIQKLYLLGVVTDQIKGTILNNRVIISRILPDESLVDLYSVDQSGTSKHLRRVIGGKIVEE